MVKTAIQTISRILGVTVLTGILNACVTTPEKFEFTMPSNNSTAVAPIVWPEPPEEAHYQYIGDLRGESNKLKSSKDKKSPFQRFFAGLVGMDSEYIPLLDVLRPQQGVVDKNGRIYVTDPGLQAVFVFDEITGEFFIWNEKKLNIPFLSPVGIALTETSVLVSDSEQGLIFEFDLAGNILRTFGRNALLRPTGIAYDKEKKRILVSDTDDDNIKVFSLQGKLLKVIGSKGTDPGQFNRPTFIAHQNNKLYVSDSLNARVQVFNEEDKPVNSIGQRGLYVGNFSRPKGVAIDSDGNIYVTESYYDHLLIFNSVGEFLMSIGGSGNKPGTFSQPTAVWIDDKDRVFVSDMLNSRVSIFQYLGDK